MTNREQGRGPVAVVAFVGLGSNVGDRLAALNGARADIQAHPRAHVLSSSSVYETEAHVLPGAPKQADHLNAVLRVETSLSPLGLLRFLHKVERAYGRDPAAPKWSPRPLDLDLLVFGTLSASTPRLDIPHRRIAARRFVLAPLAEIAPDLVVFEGGRTAKQLLEETEDRGRIARTENPGWPS